nr:hypothetical protein [Tanacetum cinerariifolium]
MINKKKVSLDVDIFREILQFCPKILGQTFEDLPLEHDILSFIRDLGHSGDIIYLFNVSVECLHQPWRAFATIINKCLNGKETGMDKIHLLFQIECKEAKKTNNMPYPRFTKIIIDYFMLKDQSISRNKMFWHTARNDTMFTSMRCISRHEDTQVYEKTPKPKYIQKKADSDTSPKQKPVQDTKGTRLKTKAKVAKSEKKKQPAKIRKAKGLDVSSKSKVPDEQHLKMTGAYEGTGTIPGVLDVPVYESESKKESWGNSGEEDEDYENDSEDKSDANDDDNKEGDDTNGVACCGRGLKNGGGGGTVVVKPDVILETAVA